MLTLTAGDNDIYYDDIFTPNVIKLLSHSNMVLSYYHLLTEPRLQCKIKMIKHKFYISLSESLRTPFLWFSFNKWVGLSSSAQASSTEPVSYLHLIHTEIPYKLFPRFLSLFQYFFINILEVFVYQPIWLTALVSIRPKQIKSANTFAGVNHNTVGVKSITNKTW